MPLGPCKTAVPLVASRSAQPSMVAGLVSGVGVSLARACRGRDDIFDPMSCSTACSVAITAAVVYGGAHALFLLDGLVSGIRNHRRNRAARATAAMPRNPAARPKLQTVLLIVRYVTPKCVSRSASKTPFAVLSPNLMTFE
jgi:hypothetical protein